MWNYTYSTIRDATHSCMGVGKVETKTGYKMELGILGDPQNDPVSF